MTYDPEWHHRQSTRWRGHDYAGEGVYFVTMCTEGREPIFGEIVEGKMIPNELGQIVAEEWTRSAVIRPELALAEYVVMPNHLHGIVTIDQAHDAGDVLDHGAVIGERDMIGRDRAHGRAPLQGPRRSLGSFVAGFKVASTKRINALRGLTGTPVWQRNYHDRVIRDEAELARIQHYILTNPERWQLDEDNPARWRRPSLSDRLRQDEG